MLIKVGIIYLGMLLVVAVIYLIMRNVSKGKAAKANEKYFFSYDNESKIFRWNCI